MFYWYLYRQGFALTAKTMETAIIGLIVVFIIQFGRCLCKTGRRLSAVRLFDNFVRVYFKQ